MDNIIDRVINEIARRLASSRRDSQQSFDMMEPSEQLPLGVSQPVQQPPMATSEPMQGPGQSNPTQPPLGTPVQQPQVAASEPAVSHAPPAIGHDPQVESRMVSDQLQKVVAEAREELDAAALIVVELRESIDQFSLRISATGQRLNDLDSSIQASAMSSVEQPAAQWGAAPPPPSADPAAGFAPPAAPDPLAPPPPPSAPATPNAPAAPSAPATPHAPHAPATPGADPYPVHPEYEHEHEAVIPTRTISLTVASLSNLTVVSVVEAALLRIPGVREVALRQLQGREAVLEVRLDEGTGLISGLRKSLPLAFDITESSDQSLAISLSYSEAQPQTATNGGTTGTPLT